VTRPGAEHDDVLVDVPAWHSSCEGSGDLDDGGFGVRHAEEATDPVRRGEPDKG
jgi:hypothetical protein